MPNMPIAPWGSTVRDQRALVEIHGDFLPEALEYGEQVTHYTVTCRECGDLTSLSVPQELHQAGVLQLRHLSEHITLLGLELQEAAR